MLQRALYVLTYLGNLNQESDLVGGNCATCKYWELSSPFSVASSGMRSFMYLTHLFLRMVSLFEFKILECAQFCRLLYPSFSSVMLAIFHKYANSIVITSSAWNSILS